MQLKILLIKNLNTDIPVKQLSYILNNNYVLCLNLNILFLYIFEKSIKN